MPSLPEALVFFLCSVQQPGRECKAARCPRLAGSPRPFSLAYETTSVLLTFRHGAARQTDLGEHRGVIAQRLVDVRDHLHDLREQCALAVVDDLGDEVG